MQTNKEKGGRSDIHCKIKGTLLIRDLKPALNVVICKLLFYNYYFLFIFSSSVNLIALRI